MSSICSQFLHRFLFWFVMAIPKYSKILNTLQMPYYSLLRCDSVLHSVQETNTYLHFSSFTARPVCEWVTLNFETNSAASDRTYVDTVYGEKIKQIVTQCVGLTVLYKFCNNKNTQFTANNLTKGHKVFQSYSPLLSTSTEIEVLTAHVHPALSLEGRLRITRRGRIYLYSP